MTWFLLYLAATPNAPNAAAVREEIEQLDVQAQINIEHLLSGLRDTARKLPDFVPNWAPTPGGVAAVAQDAVAALFAYAGDNATAERIEESIDSRKIGADLKIRYAKIADGLINMGNLQSAEVWRKQLTYKASAIQRPQQSCGDAARNTWFHAASCPVSIS
jgi:hypothetical protein